ncbi:helix-turn-helix domain-containing protein [Algoriphagus namhaensis]|uniref:Helix-turn-helix domain-containing protein n=1 Tax=Algoriphagus namhaensis TaxID=915353 RepID=A0ABV8AMN6_9BACT
MKKIISIYLLLNVFSNSFGQDTLFVAKHHFESAVQNVFDANGAIYAKTVSGLYQFRDEGDWEPIDLQFSKPYVFYNENFYESDFIPKVELFDADPMKELIPLKGSFIATAAATGSRLFVAIGSALFEYEIRRHYSKSYHTLSIRDIYIEDSLKVVSTYSGIYVNDTLRPELPEYSNGPLQKIGNRFFLSWDDLAEFFPPDSLQAIPSGTSLFAGKARKLISLNEELYALNTKSVSKVNSEFSLEPIHQGLDYLDLESFGTSLIFSTSQGISFHWTNGMVDTLAVLPSRIKDIYTEGANIFLASDAGVYSLRGIDPSTLEQISTTKNNVMTQIDDLGNFWIASENGLFVLTSEYPEPIPIITGVEFNREALLLKNHILYVGAVNGLYELDTYELAKSYIPNKISSLSITPSAFENYGVLGLLILGFLLGLGSFWLYFKKRNKIFPRDEKENESTWQLSNIEHIIRSENILTVDSLAAHFETNTVQLNRNFKKLGTTPGKFLKKIKLKEAKEYLKSGVPLEEISSKIGYSVKFLKQELNID